MTGKEMGNILRKYCLFMLPEGMVLDVDEFINSIEKLDNKPQEVHMSKPPLGLMPQDIYEKKVNTQRINDIFAAIERFSEVGRPIPKEWIDELYDLIMTRPHWVEKKRR